MTKWKEASLSLKRQVLYYSSVAAGGYGGVGIVLAEHTRKGNFSDHS